MINNYCNFRKLKLYEEQELTMQVFSEPEGGMGTERRGSGISMGMGDMSQDNTYATIQHPLPTNRHRSTTPDYTTLPGNHDVSCLFICDRSIIINAQSFVSCTNRHWVFKDLRFNRRPT